MNKSLQSGNATKVLVVEYLSYPPHLQSPPLLTHFLCKVMYRTLIGAQKLAYRKRIHIKRDDLFGVQDFDFDLSTVGCGKLNTDTSKRQKAIRHGEF